MSTGTVFTRCPQCRTRLSITLQQSQSNRMHNAALTCPRCQNSTLMAFPGKITEVTRILEQAAPEPKRRGLWDRFRRRWRMDRTPDTPPPITVLAVCPHCQCEWRLTVIVHRLLNAEREKDAVWICQRCRITHHLPIEGLVTEVKPNRWIPSQAVE